jgi:hypothetical protein
MLYVYIFLCYSETSFLRNIKEKLRWEKNEFGGAYEEVTDHRNLPNLENYLKSLIYYYNRH